MALRFGAAAWALGKTLLFSTELEKSADQDYRGRIGLEWQVMARRLAMRAGLDHDRICAGLGLSWGAFSLDYALRTDPVDSSRGDHRFSLNFEFDMPKGEAL
jgi:hypothetical protein